MDFEVGGTVRAGVVGGMDSLEVLVIVVGVDVEADEVEEDVKNGVGPEGYVHGADLRRLVAVNELLEQVVASLEAISKFQL
jgi:hypothetical protein